MFSRLLAIQGSWNYETLLGNGIGFCVEPALRLLPGGVHGAAYQGGTGARRAATSTRIRTSPRSPSARSRAPSSTGVPPERIERFRTALCGPLGSVGDRLVWAGWLPFCSLVALVALRARRAAARRRARLPRARTTRGTSRCGCGGCTWAGRAGLRRRVGARRIRCCAAARRTLARGRRARGRRRDSARRCARRRRRGATLLGVVARRGRARRRAPRPRCTAAWKGGSSSLVLIAVFALYLGGPLMAERTVQIVNKNGLHARPAAEIVKIAAQVPERDHARAGRPRGERQEHHGRHDARRRVRVDARAARRRRRRRRGARRARRRSSRTSSGSGSGSTAPSASPRRPASSSGRCTSCAGRCPTCAHRIIPDESVARRDRAPARRDRAGEGAAARSSAQRVEATPARRRRRSSTCSCRFSTTASSLRGVEELIRQNLGAEKAFDLVMLEWRTHFARHAAPMLRERVGDLTDVHIRVLSLLLDLPDHDPVDLPTGSNAILVTHDLTPSLTVQLDRASIAGIATDAGTRTSHVAILARSLGLPAVVGLRDATHAAHGRRARRCSTAARACSPSTRRDAEIDAYRERARAGGGRRGRARASSPRSRRSPLDGVRITLRANVDLPEEAEAAARSGAEGVGLMRTEFLVVGRATMPDEDEQYRAYARVVEAFAGRAGGHPHLRHRRRQAAGRRLPAEPNPFLGWRAIRMCLDQPEMFKRAAPRAAARRGARRRAHHAAARRHARRGAAGAHAARARRRASCARAACRFRADVPLGVMIETPAAAVAARHARAATSTFFSIGTNDLVQYTLAVDRGNANLASRFTPLHPGGAAAHQAHRRGGGAWATSTWRSAARWRRSR